MARPYSILGTSQAMTCKSHTSLDPSGGYMDCRASIAPIGGNIEPRDDISAASGLAPKAMDEARCAGFAHRRGRDYRDGQGNYCGPPANYIAIAPPPSVDATCGQDFWTSISALCRPRSLLRRTHQEHIAFEVYARDSVISLGIWVPATVAPGLVEEAVASAYPAATVDVTSPPLLIPADWIGTGGELRLGRAEFFPLRTDHTCDPWRYLLGALARISQVGAGAFQVLVRPGATSKAAKCRRAAGQYRAGQAMSAGNRIFDSVVDTFLPAASGTTASAPSPLITDPARAVEIEAMVDKCHATPFEVIARYAVAVQLVGGRDRTGELAGLAHLLAASFEAYRAHNHLKRLASRHACANLNARRMWRPGRGDLYSLAELAALAHVPLDDDVAGLVRAGARPRSVAPMVGTSGKVLGESVGFAGRPGRSVALAVCDARHHLHVVGATGSGKSTLLANLILSDIEAGRGTVVIDPKGDLVYDVVSRWPPDAPSPIIIDPQGGAGSVTPPVLNLLDSTVGSDELAVGQIVSIFHRIFEAYWGPRTDDIMRSAALTLMAHARASGTVASLPGLLELLTKPALRQAARPAVAGSKALASFWDWYEGLGESGRAQATGPVLNKLRAFLVRDFACRLMGPGKSTFSMGGVLDSGALLVRIPKGIIGDDTCRLIGSFVVARVWQAATERSASTEAARRDCSMYVDECHNFLNLPRAYDEMLAEARGYRLSLVLAHQYLGQLPRELNQAVSGNARNKIYFALSPEDAHQVVRHVEPSVSEHDLSHTRAFHATCRLVVAGEDSPAFTLATRPLRRLTPGRGEQVRGGADSAQGAARHDVQIGEVSLDPWGKQAGETDRPEKTGGIDDKEPSGR